MYPCILLEAFLLTNDRKGLKSFKMVTNYFPSFNTFSSSLKSSDFILSFSWIAGFALGCSASRGGAVLIASWMRAADLGSVSIVWLFTSLLLPFLFSAAAVIFQLNWVVYLIAFCKAFLFGFCTCGIMLSYHHAGWLICLLLFFSEFSLFPCLFFFLRRCLSGKPVRWLAIATPSAYAFLIVSVDRCVISPFLASLI